MAELSVAAWFLAGWSIVEGDDEDEDEEGDEELILEVERDDSDGEDDYADVVEDV